jgi:YggT family protein
MNNPYLSSATVYLIDTIFTIYLILVLLRFLFQLVRADFYNPLSQFIVKATNPPLIPLRRVIPGLKGIDVAAIVLMIVLQMSALYLMHLSTGRAIAPGGLVVLSLADLLSLLLNLFLITILIQVVLSWVNPQARNPIVSLLHSLNEPVLRPARRVLPSVSGIDFSPLLVLVAIQLTKILMLAPIRDVGMRLAYN